ncbi:MAG: hypothetical protein OSA81_10415 [Longimicrobiales bacterium]|nr:hypothetical protein [Longimicrobiales bacterium]
MRSDLYYGMQGINSGDFMFGLIAAGVVGVYGHIKSRKFVGQKLRYTSIVEKPALGLWAGVGAAVVAAPVVGLIGSVPFVEALMGAPIAIAIGAGVGTGVALGVKDTKEPPKLLDD